jgi:hypothetical protein
VNEDLQIMSKQGHQLREFLATEKTADYLGHLQFEEV